MAKFRSRAPVRPRRVAAALLAAAALLPGCGGGGAAPLVLPPVPAMQASADPFDDGILHYVELEVAEEHLPALVPFSDAWVPARLTFDGVALDGVGVRHKGSASALPLGKKSGFAVKTNEFAPGQRLHGVRRFSLDNEVQDPSLVAAHLSYEVFRRAGLPARRTAFARVTFNGTYYGVYLVAEQIDADFVRRWFAEDEGNLYEGEFTDLTDVEAMQLKTNEDVDDRSDLEALRDLLRDADDATLLATLPSLVDVDAFVRFSACEALCHHWDGYGGRAAPRVRRPNNYYVYADPDRGLAFIPHGTDQTFETEQASAVAPPRETARLAARLFATPAGRAAYRATLVDLLDGAWDAAALAARLEAVLPLIEGSVPCDVAGNPGYDNWRRAVDRVRRFVRDRGAYVRQHLAFDFG